MLNRIIDNPVIICYNDKNQFYEQAENPADLHIKPEDGQKVYPATSGFH
jgi:hypothetical protein